MDNVQNYDGYINIPSSQTDRCLDILFTTALSFFKDIPHDATETSVSSTFITTDVCDHTVQSITDFSSTVVWRLRLACNEVASLLWVYAN
jgi:hypothetical protein